jgi:dipeptidyl aminopeptidase/acylaminoacyl peptidase
MTEKLFYSWGSIKNSRAVQCAVTDLEGSVKVFAALGLALGLSLAAPFVPSLASNAQAGPPIEAFIEQDVFRGAALSGDGRYVAGIRREAVGDVLVVLDWETKKSTPIQYARIDQNMEIVQVRWKGPNRLVFVVQQKVRVVAGSASLRRTEQIGDAFIQVQRIYASNADGAGLVSLYDPGDKDLPRNVSATITDMLAADDDHILITTPAIGGTELRKVNVRTGASTEFEKGTPRTFNWTMDQNAVPVIREQQLPLGRGTVVERRAVGTNNWIEIARFRGAEGANSGPDFEPVGPALGSGKVFVLARPEGKDTSGLYIYDANTGQFVDEIYSTPGFDMVNAIRDVENNKILAACFAEYRWKCVPKDEAFGRVWRGIERYFGDKVNVRAAGRSSDGKRLLLNIDGPQDMGSFYLYDSQARTMDWVGGARPEMKPEQLPSQMVVHYAARDGFALWGYLWLPPGVTEQTAKNLPTIVLPHGGPEGRDLWGWDPFGQWWAANGYAVFQPNFRGGGGFGRSFVLAGWRQWGQRMSHDVRDGAEHLVKAGISDRGRMCVAGWSYGGFATGAAAMLDGDLFKCAYAGAGVFDLPEMLRWTRDGDANRRTVRGPQAGNGGSGSEGVGYKYWVDAIGHPDRDRDMLNRYSVARNPEKVNIPVFLISGDDDIQVPIRQSEILYDALKKAGKDVEFVVLKEEGHQWSPMTVEHRRVVLESSLGFFRKHLGPGVTPPPAQ